MGGPELPFEVTAWWPPAASSRAPRRTNYDWENAVEAVARGAQIRVLTSDTSNPYPAFRHRGVRIAVRTWGGCYYIRKAATEEEATDGG